MRAAGLPSLWYQFWEFLDINIAVTLTRRSLPKVMVLFNINFAPSDRTYSRGRTNILVFNFDSTSSIAYIRQLRQKNNYFKGAFRRSTSIIKIIIFQLWMLKGASTSVRGRKQGIRDRGECERKRKSCLFSIHRTSEWASVPLVIRWLPEWVYIHISMIANIFFFEVLTPDQLHLPVCRTYAT